MKEYGFNIENVCQKARQLCDPTILPLKIQNKISLSLGEYEDRVQDRIALLSSQDFCQRLWQKDATLWKSVSDKQEMIRNSLGWLDIVDKMIESLDEIKAFIQEIKDAGFRHVVHMGMGGSSLAPLVFLRTFSAENGLALSVLDTTDPASIKKLEESIPIENTLFIVASKSGSTAEPLAFKDYFYELVKKIKGDRAGENFVVITDPNNSLEKTAKLQGFRRIFLNASDIGGRYSALSYFGLIPAALMGINVGEVLNRAREAVHSTLSVGRRDDCPALILGATLGELALHKRNKVTLIMDKRIESFGLWLEQLMAESTGKEGKGLIPIANEALGTPSSYGTDRLFVNLTVKNAEKNSENVVFKNAVAALKDFGHPVICIEIADCFDLGEEFFLWEFATAVAGAVLEINAFDQPNVQESKDNTDRLLAQVTENLPKEKPKLSEGSLSFYSNSTATSGADFLSQLLKKATSGDYIAIMAFLPETPSAHDILQNLRRSLRDKLKLATTLGYGPRFLHSTGQLHKGGPNTGIFLQLTADDSVDLPVPGRPYSFGIFKSAQAQGDLEALIKHKRRTLRIHLGSNIEKGLRELEGLMNSALNFK